MVRTAKDAAAICREWYWAFRNMGKGEEKYVLELLDAADTIEQLERERDAAIEDLRYSSECGTCGHYGLQGDNCQKCRNNAMHPHWKWRGVQEVE